MGTGTSQGVPVIGCECEVCQSLDFRDKRLRSSILIETHGFHFVIDTGPDFRQQMLRARVKKIDAVLFTHEHKDHTAGLDDIRAFNFLQKKDMPIYGKTQVIEQLKREFAYIFADKKYPGIPQIEVHEIDKEPFHIQGQQIIPIEVLHHKLPVLGFRIDDFCYITDANYISDIEKDKIKGCKVLVLNALQQSEHLSHFTLTEALDLIKEIAPEMTYLTHMSHRMGTHAEASKLLPEKVAFSYDGLTIEI